MFLLDTNVVSGLRKVRAGKADPRPYRDGLIAATALAHGLPVYTSNPADFEGIEGLEVHATKPMKA